ncbi:hypothetical protein TBLA_0C04140 [Henningerozyma blattae CBS 6284]|uniref:Casein kinase II subunit beta n=1 Tax=Henningerozyma blattae (strain ATCC 34711 / CBS 6284 / DSM 70876 / NBRC 10599 / NRRL Y-10934 / UCD 77-7) TaxID=1071380 RepID=I2H1G2_HENB6|nr:hypothetical protein TBLA_0C04140 [Tetrapisispora blattae CBS 6284]CCH60214.1 hypothetical protein TBLA_0C04140 [Tetrapisispora blattae CBS 6284]
MSEYIADRNDDDSSEDSGSYEEWIPSFCARFGHEYYCQIPSEFLEDDFNMTALALEVPLYRQALDLILDLEAVSDDEAEHGENGQPEVSRSLVEHAAEQLYGLAHARYVLTRPGLQALAEKFDRRAFGTCPRYHCGGMQLLPCGLSDTLGRQPVRLYCACCGDLYVPAQARHAQLDGCFWGTSLPGVFLQHFPELGEYVGKRPVQSYSLRVFGFGVNERAVSGARMAWLRQRPSTEEEWEEYAKCEYEMPTEVS